ncbi:hypothetical protein FSPOR_8194 [Fusarium sporotrichioides]|uniref:Uncharacterized protein n=1 Tax=Fusarium sporotrichioides TaxID=5514 RepID=A0A395RVF5_FUSSP|nr:hypothetical protein FSPOR_8194 [Fusarium sporotrichioides]
MEPPTKRRHGPSPSKKAQDEDDDDELASHPQEIRIRRDPDIQLALKRANANQKLHATMAHIIEKYSRNFEGIGDEIDMATGEIVVNNGHLHNMRDEGDVEGLWVEGESNIDEDEGIRLEDLTDEYSDIEEQTNEIPNSQTENENSQVSRTKENHTETDPQSQNDGIDQASNNVSNTASRQTEAPQDKSTTLHTGLLHDDPQLNPSSFGHGGSSGSMMPHPAFGSWGMMPGFPMQAWGRDDIPPYFNMPPSMPGPWYTGGRYETASNSGQASIWGRNWTRKTKRVGSMKGLFKNASNKQRSDAAVGVGAEASNGDRGSEPKSTGETPNGWEAPLSDRTINASDEDDDFLCSRSSAPTAVSQSSPVPSIDKTLSKNRRLHDAPHKPLEETDGNALKLSRQSDEKDDSSRRRSGRARKQTEYMGKISWNDARKFKKSGKTFTIQIHRADPSLREEFQSVDLNDEETEGGCPSPSEQTGKGLPSTDEARTKVSFHKLVVPDSQDTATPFNSSAPQASQSKNSEEPSAFTQSMIRTTELSDDEAPLILSRIRAPRRQNAALMAVSPASEMPTRHHEHSAEPADVTSAPLDDNNNETPAETKIIVGVVDNTVQSLKRKRGRPIGSTASAKVTAPKASVPVRAKEVKPPSPTTTISTTGELPQSTKRKRGRPRKSDGATSTTQDEANYPAKQPSLADDEVPASDQQRPADEVPIDWCSGISPPLSHELRWLLKTKPEDSTLDRTCDTFSYKFVRPRKPKDILQQVKDDIPEPQEVTQETKKAPKDIADDLKEQPILQKPQTPIQDVDTIMEDVPETREYSESTQDNQPLPSSPPVSHDDGTPDDNEPQQGDKLVEDGSPILDIITDDEPVENEESLPSLPQDAPIPEASTPRKPKHTGSSFMEPPSSSQKPHTPRHRSIRTNRAPSSRRSLLSFVSDSDSDTEGSRDELTRRVKSHSKSASARPSSKKIWRPATLTREVHRTPSKRRVHEVSSPVGTVKTPGGTIRRTCGVDGYHCGRDYCFACI